MTRSICHSICRSCHQVEHLWSSEPRNHKKLIAWDQAACAVRPGEHGAAMLALSAVQGDQSGAADGVGVLKDAKWKILEMKNDEDIQSGWQFSVDNFSSILVGWLKFVA